MSGRGGGGRGGRDRYRRDYHPRYEDKSSSHSGSGRYNSNSRKIAPPSRHLWVGNLSHSLSEDELTHHFLYFGDLENVAFQPGRSYAFLNFCSEDDAIAALKSLQGFPVAGNPLRIEFAKADKSSASSHEEDYSQYENDQYSDLRESPFLQREFRDRRTSPEQFYPEKSSMSHKNAEPSAVLWIGFPASLKVDEIILRKAFLPFGEIEKITAFPGRSYAFVQFRSVTSACRAKDALQGKLFGNPRVHICFAKSESGSSNVGRNSINAPSSPHLRLNSRLGSSENFWQDRKFGSLTGDPSTKSQIFSDLDSGDSDSYSTNRKTALWSSGINSFEKRRFGEVGPELGVSPDRYEYQSSPTREKYGHLHDISRRLPQTSILYEEPWDLPEDARFCHGAKKLKISSFPLEKELPDYPFSDSEQEKHVFPRSYSDYPQADHFDRKFDAGPLAYKRIHDYPMNLSLPQEERSDQWKESYDSLQLGSASLLSNPVDRKRLTPESDRSSLNEWKWEGTIAKGGTPVCRARCFPVGKILDVMLPEFLDCTARTGLDMLSKHYYQAASASVVFFVPESDADIGFYNEFMNYLGEKERAAVAKLDEKTTLFLVPPSDFSQKVLKVPGKLSISGVILRLEHPSSNIGSIHPEQERRDTNLLSFPGNTSTSFPDSSRSGVSNLSFSGNVISSAPTASFSGSGHAVSSRSDPREDRHEYHPLHGNPRSGPNWSSQQMQDSVPGSRITPSQVSHSRIDPRIQDHPLVVTRAMQETGPANSTYGTSGIPSSGNSKSSLQEMQSGVSLSMPNASLQSQQLAQLASSLLGQQRHSGSNASASGGNDFRQINAMIESENMFGASQKYTSDGNSQFGQVKLPQQSLQQTSNVSPAPHLIERELKTGAQGNQQLQNPSSQEEAEADPQKRLQATLQLAAALLQQIQQGKGN
ncbi:flowering time control protein FPA [Ziziphus jujuba]|uniref:Flowering time control protein FPA n=1 Tax=Ziziphus jujuba TaxID=326968 RepID=A0A6P4A544_ZIZJJ|nr:flowering time control protein FPA [Ziziphus jujuba]